MVSILACALLILGSKILGSILYAKDYFVAWKCVPILLIAYVFSGLSGFLPSIFTATKKTNYLFISTSIGAVINVLLNLVLIDWFGILGAAYTTLLGFFVTWAIRINVSGKILKIDVPIIKHLIIYVVLFFDAFYMYREFPYMHFISIILFILLLLLNLDEIKFFLNRTKTFVISKRKTIN